MKHLCPVHGASLHCYVCQHVQDACESCRPMPLLGRRNQADVICKACLTSDIKALLDRLDTVDEGIFACHHELESRIGYSPMCTECLYEKSGLDLRRQVEK
jgi:hypothetical protein